jgi:allophanate hydrolase subunit 1
MGATLRLRGCALLECANVRALQESRRVERECQQDVNASDIERVREDLAKREALVVQAKDAIAAKARLGQRLRERHAEAQAQRRRVEDDIEVQLIFVFGMIGDVASVC